MYSNLTFSSILNIETAMNVEMTTFFQRTFGDNKTWIKIENKMFLLFTQKIAYYFTQYSLYCTKLLCSILWSRLRAVKCIYVPKKITNFFFNFLILNCLLMRSLLYFRIV